MTTIFRSMRGRHMALAIALATGAVMTTGVVADPAQAQRKKRGGGAQYSPEFQAAYAPLTAQLQDATSDVAPLVAAVPTLTASLSTPDDKFVGGNAIYQIGRRANDYAIQLQGIELMLGSGKVPPENVGPYSFQAAQLAYNTEAWAKARTHAQAALAAGYTDNEPEMIVAESYFAEGNPTAGVDFIKQAVARKAAAGETPPRQWLRRGLAQAFNAGQVGPANEMALLFVRYHPADDSWGDAIAVQRNFGNYQSAEMLDLLRLARLVNGLRDRHAYSEYIEVADARRYPGEVAAIISEGLASGALESNDLFIEENRTLANSRVEADRSDLPSLVRDANGSGAGLRTVVAAADAMLSYGRYSEAIGLYQKALSMPGVDAATVLTRLGMAQVGAGQYADAKTTFARVQGNRQAIARLWSQYADEKAQAAVNSAAAAPSGT